MVDLQYVKKRKKKKIAALTVFGSATVATALIIVSFLGSRVGSFTVKLRQSNVKLALTKNNDTSKSTSFLLVNELPSFDLATNNDLLNHAQIDNHSTDYLLGATFDKKTKEPNSLYFFKYTFYVNNVGTVAATYDFKLKIAENNPPRNNLAYGYDDLLRVRLYENVDESAHEYVTYAKRARTAHQDDKGNMVYNEPISGNPTDPDFPGYANIFDSQSVILSKTVPGFATGAYNRYTLLMWLEGSDPECEGTVIPEGGSLKLQIDIEAHESKE